MRKIILKQEQVHTGSLILVNSRHGFLSDPDELLIPILESAPDILLQRRAVTLLEQLMQEICGWREIVPVSGWRSLAEQQQIWDDSLRDNGPDFTKKYVALPGHSEHQTGLAVDLGLKSSRIDFIRPEFPDSGACRAFREKAAKYGFILRYPAGKEDVTGIAHEPWHFRYVGIPHAGIMAENDLTLEEYVSFLHQFPQGSPPLVHRIGLRQTAVSWLKSDGPQTEAWVPAALPYTVSGNNVDGFVLTVWKKG